MTQLGWPRARCDVGVWPKPEWRLSRQRSSKASVRARDSNMLWTVLGREAEAGLIGGPALLRPAFEHARQLLGRVWLMQGR
jgi:hypothetical protein